MQPPDGEPGSDPGDPQATPPPPGADADTTRLPFGAPPATPPTVAAACRPSASRVCPGRPGPRSCGRRRPRRSARRSRERPACRSRTRPRGSSATSSTASSCRSSARSSPPSSGSAGGTVVTSGDTTSANYAVTGGAFLVPYVVVGFAYFVFFWTGGRRATPGQQLFKLQVGNAFDGMALTLDAGGQALVRAGHVPEPVLDPARDLPAGVARRVRLGDRAVRHDRQESHQAGPPRQFRQLGGGQAVRAVVERPALDLPDHHPRPPALFVVSIIALIFLGSQLSTILSDVGTSI